MNFSIVCFDTHNKYKEGKRKTAEMEKEKWRRGASIPLPLAC